MSRKIYDGAKYRRPTTDEAAELRLQRERLVDAFARDDSAPWHEAAAVLRRILSEMRIKKKR